MKLMPRSERNALLRGLLVPALFCLLATVVFATQFAGVGFGNRHHHSWVTSQGLAIVSRATPNNGFVGHSRTFINANGTLDHDYFDRAPVFFGALTGALISLTDDLATKVWIVRQVMNAIYVLTMLLAWRLLRRLGASPLPALSMVTLSFSGYMLLYYREMLDFEHPALAGMLLLLLAIASAGQARRPRWHWLTLATLVALGLGRGHVSFGVLVLWVALEAAGIVARRGLTVEERLRALARHEATRMLLLGIVWSGLLLSWNIAQEMARRDVPLAETSIFDSLQRRLPGGERDERSKMSYANYTSIVERRLLRWYLPLDNKSGQTAHRWTLLPVLALVLCYSTNQPQARRNVLLLTAFSGLVWIFAMINHTHSHEFTVMHALGFALVFWLALLGRILQPRLIAALLVLSLALFVRTSLEVQARNSAHFRDTAVYTEDYDRILQQIGNGGQVVYSDEGLQDAVMNRARYVLGFYLGDNVLAKSLDDARYIVSSREYLAVPASLPAGSREGLQLYITQTPDNQVGFLFDRKQAEVRYLPEGLAPRHNFGGELSLGHWELRDSVQVQPCQRIRVESWWQTVAPPQADYSLQLAMTDADGGFLVSADHGLASGSTRDQAPDHWYPDGRILRIPCDAPAGEYPLIFSVYDPESNAASDKLPLIQADGSAGDTWLYLTTLFVS